MAYPINNYNYSFVSPQEFDNDIAYTSATNWPLHYLDIPITSFTNGLYQIPPNQAPPFGAFSLNLMGIGKNGNLGDVVLASQRTNDWNPILITYFFGYGSVNVPFLDGRTNIAQNINMLLRGAGAFQPFSLGLYDAGLYALGYDFQGHTNYVCSGFCFQSLASPFYGYNDPRGQFGPETTLVQRNEFEPFGNDGTFTFASIKRKNKIRHYMHRAAQ